MKLRGNGFAVVSVAFSLALVSCARPPSRSRPQVQKDGYPYQLALGHSVYNVEREPETERLRMSLVRWTASPVGSDSVFRVTNPGDRAVLIWNVRQQTLVGESGATNWITSKSDFPGPGWDRPSLPPGGTLEFPFESPGDGSWRVCLLYSREIMDRDRGSTNRLFDGTFEVMGPVVRETGDEAQD